jgi:hypothetical protein
MEGTAAVTLSNENGLSRSRPSSHLQPPPTPPYRGRLRPPAGPLCSPRPLPSDEPAVLGLRAHRVDLTRRHNDRSPEREE